MNVMSSIGGIHTVLSPSWGHDVGLITLTLAKTVHVRVDQFLLWARLLMVAVFRAVFAGQRL